jgi:FAD synthase
MVGGGLVYSCCSHLEHSTSVKRFVSLQLLNLRHSVILLGRVISPSQGRYLTQTQNKHKQTSMPQVGFEPTIATFERAKKIHVLDRVATVISKHIMQQCK